MPTCCRWVVTQQLFSLAAEPRARHNRLRVQPVKCMSGVWHHELELPCLVGLVPRGPAVPDRAPPLPSSAPPQPAQGLPAGAPPVPRPGPPLPLPFLFWGKLKHSHWSGLQAIQNIGIHSVTYLKCSLLCSCPCVRSWAVIIFYCFLFGCQPCFCAKLCYCPADGLLALQIQAI